MNTQDNNNEETVDVTPSAEFQIQALNNTVAQLEREKGYEEEKAKRYRRLLRELAEGTLSLAETLDYEIGDSLKATLTELADCRIVELPTKTVTLTGQYVATFEYSVEVNAPIFTNLDDIQHYDYADEIAYSVETESPLDWSIDAGDTYEN